MINVIIILILLSYFFQNSNGMTSDHSFNSYVTFSSTEQETANDGTASSAEGEGSIKTA